MKVKCIKDTIGFKKGEIIEDLFDGYRYSSKYPEYFQEVKEEKKLYPYWKIGDPVVKDWVGCDNAYYYRIQEITKVGDNYRYDGFEKERLRDPTQEELSLYFR